MASLEDRVHGAVEDASVARHLAAANDRDLADLTDKVDSMRTLLNAHAEQTAAGFSRLEGRATVRACGRSQGWHTSPARSRGRS